MVIVFNTENKVESLLMERLYGFLINQEEVETMGTTKSGNIERLTINLRENTDVR